MSNQSKITRRLAELSRQLFRDHFHLINSLTIAVDDCGLRLGIVHMGTEDSGSRLVSVFGWYGPYRSIIFEWSTTERGNLEATFSLI